MVNSADILYAEMPKDARLALFPNVFIPPNPDILRDLCKTPPFAQFRRQAQILILKILNVFLWLKFSPSLNLNKIEHFSKVSPLNLCCIYPDHIVSVIFKICNFTSESVNSILNPAALEWPPPPNEAAIAATSTVPSERRLT